MEKANGQAVSPFMDRSLSIAMTTYHREWMDWVARPLFHALQIIADPQFISNNNNNNNNNNNSGSSNNNSNSNNNITDNDINYINNLNSVVANLYAFAILSNY